MLIVHVTSTDPAGSVYRLATAVNNHTKHRARVITTNKIETFDFRGDMDKIVDQGDEVEQLLVDADVIHLHKVREDFVLSYPLPDRGIVRDFKVSDFLEVGGKKKKVIYHVHGHISEREDPIGCAKFYAERKARVLASTPDLEHMMKPTYDGISYFPNCVPINDVRYLPRQTDKKADVLIGTIKGSKTTEARYVVVQTPTNTILKNCAFFEDVIESIKTAFPILFIRCSNMDHDTALVFKRQAHVVFDHIEGYYGLSSLEGLSMGKPVIAGLSDPVVASICDFFKINEYELPWQRANTKAGVQMALSDILGNDDFRRVLGKQSRAFMENVWSDKAIAERLVGIYESL